MLTDSAYKDAAACLKMLAQPNRLKIVDLLLVKPLTVGEISLALGISQNLTSEHLKLLRLCNFIKPIKSGRSVTYQIQEQHLFEIMSCIYNKFGGQNGNKTRRPKEPTKRKRRPNT
jgi:DNA-binding transcriptional ArsR family regulator